MGKEFVDKSTGEVIEVASYRTVEQQKAYQVNKKREAVLKRSRSPFVFSEMDAFKGGLSEMKNKELGYFICFQT